MTSPQPEPLFRPEAVEYQASHRGPGQPLRLAASGWTAWAYWVLLVLVAAGVAATALVKVDGERLLWVLVPVLRDWWSRLLG